MYIQRPQPLFHQCAHGGGLWLSVAVVDQVAGHGIVISQACPVCGQRIVQPTCPAGLIKTPVPVQRTYPIPWLPILKSVVSVQCPTCGIAMDVADAIAKDPQATPQERADAAGISTGIAVVGGAIILGSLAAILLGRLK